MAERNVKWNKATETRTGNAERLSKCGRFRIVSKRMASGRNGHFNARAYAAERVDGTRIGRLCDTLRDALDLVEYENDPSWEPS